MKPILAVYYFIVGDMISLLGVLIGLVLLILLNTIPALSALRPVSGPLLIVVVLLTLVLTLARDVSGNRH
jgi:hypothetical protein